MLIFGAKIQIYPLKKINVAHSARKIVKWDFFRDFQTLWLLSTAGDIITNKRTERYKIVKYHFFKQTSIDWQIDINKQSSLLYIHESVIRVSLLLRKQGSFGENNYNFYDIH